MLHSSRAGTGRDFVPGHPSPYYHLGNRYHSIFGMSTVKIYIWMKIISSVSLSVCPWHVCIGRVWKCRNVHVIVYKSGLAGCGDNLYKPYLLNFPLFAWNSFLFIYFIISIRVIGSKFVPGYLVYPTRTSGTQQVLVPALHSSSHDTVLYNVCPTGQNPNCFRNIAQPFMLHAYLTVTLIINFSIRNILFNLAWETQTCMCKAFSLAETSDHLM